MKTKKSLIGLAVAIVSSLLLFTACKERPSKGAFMLDYVAESMDLTAEQQENLSTIRDEIMEQVELMHEDKAEVHDVLRVQLGSENLDKQVVHQLIASHRGKMDSVIELAVDRLATFHSGLSAEQREKLIAKLEKFEKHHEKKFHH